MLGALAIIISNTLFVGIEFIWKRQRLAGVSSLANLAMFGFAVPIFLVTVFYIFPQIVPTYSLNYSLEYWLYLAVWLMPVFISNFGYVYLFKFQTLLEQNAYKIAFTTIIAWMLDITFLKIEYTYILYAAVFCFLTSGWLLSKYRSLSTAQAPLFVTLTILFVVSALGALEWSIYKKAFDFQSHVLVHIFVAQSVLFTSFFILGGRTLLKDIRERRVKKLHLLLVTSLVVPFVFLEGFALSQLPVAVVVLASVWPMALYAVFDLKTKQLTLSKSSVLAFFLVVLGLVLLGVSGL